MFRLNLGTLAKRARNPRTFNLRWKSDQENLSETASEKKKAGAEVAMPPEPTYCCMSGCANCVWIKYAQEVCQLFDDGDVIAKKKISEKVQDPKLRAFLFTQLGLNEGETKV